MGASGSADKTNVTVIRQGAIVVLACFLAVFFAFVGFHKSVDSLADLSRYGSWTIWLPTFLGKAVGWSEIACALGLIAGLSAKVARIGLLAAVTLILNQICAATFHGLHGETGALPQNAVLIALLAFLAAGFARNLASSNLKGPN